MCRGLRIDPHREKVAIAAVNRGSAQTSVTFGTLVTASLIRTIRFTMPKLAVLFDAGQAVLSTFDLDEVLQRILAIARDFFHLPNVAILLLDREAQQLCVRSQIGWDAGKDKIFLG